MEAAALASTYGVHSGPSKGVAWVTTTSTPTSSSASSSIDAFRRFSDCSDDVMALPEGASVTLSSGDDGASGSSDRLAALLSSALVAKTHGAGVEQRRTLSWPHTVAQATPTRGHLDSKIVQVVDDVKTHLLNAVRVEVEVLRAEIVRLEKKVKQTLLNLHTRGEEKQNLCISSSAQQIAWVADLEFENEKLRQYAPVDVLAQLQARRLNDAGDRLPCSGLQCVF